MTNMVNNTPPPDQSPRLRQRREHPLSVPLRHDARVADHHHAPSVPERMILPKPCAFCFTVVALKERTLRTELTPYVRAAKWRWLRQRFLFERLAFVSISTVAIRQFTIHDLRMTADRTRIVSASRLGARLGDLAPPLPLVTHLHALDAADWLRASLTTFAASVASILPGHFPAYARVLHPFDSDGGSPIAAPTWRELTALAGREPLDPAAAADFALFGVPNVQARVGTLPLALIEALVEHLHLATTTPEQCFFAVWEGFGASVVSRSLAPQLELPHRAYHVFAGPIAAARTSYSAIAFAHQSANLWWPADQAWFVATEIDFAWTYVGGSRADIEAVLADSRLEAVETSATARW